MNALNYVLSLRLVLYVQIFAHVPRMHVITFTAVIQLMKQQVRYTCKWRGEFNSVVRVCMNYSQYQKEII